MINLNESLDDVLSSVLLNQNKNNFELLNQSINQKKKIIENIFTVWIIWYSLLLFII